MALCEVQAEKIPKVWSSEEDRLQNDSTSRFKEKTFHRPWIVQSNVLASGMMQHQRIRTTPSASDYNSMIGWRKLMKLDYQVNSLRGPSSMGFYHGHMPVNGLWNCCNHSGRIGVNHQPVPATMVWCPTKFHNHFILRKDQPTTATVITGWDGTQLAIQICPWSATVSQQDSSYLR